MKDIAQIRRRRRKLLESIEAAVLLLQALDKFEEKCRKQNSLDNLKRRHLKGDGK